MAGASLSLPLSLSLSLFLSLSIADEKFEGFINSVASGEASRLTEQRDPGEISMHLGAVRIAEKEKVHAN